MSIRKFTSIGQGVYSLTEAERFTGVPCQRIRRWAKGYTYRYKGEERRTPPIVATEVEPIDGITILDFADLIEIRFLNAFREYGVGWKAIRIAAYRAKELLGTHRPFSSRMFKTDGRTILADLVEETGDRTLLDLVKSQYAFKRIVSPFLVGLDFDGEDEPRRWWPLGVRKSVVLDPRRAFGAPIVARRGVPTKVLSDAFNVEKSFSFVAKWYEVKPQEVKHAVEFERSLAA